MRKAIHVNGNIQMEGVVKWMKPIINLIIMALAYKSSRMEIYLMKTIDFPVYKWDNLVSYD